MKISPMTNRLYGIGQFIEFFFGPGFIWLEKVPITILAIKTGNGPFF